MSLPPADWVERAACRGMDSSVFFSPNNERGPSRRDRESRALNVCARCPVEHECLDAAMDEERGEAKSRYGVRGGRTAEERVVLSRRHARRVTA